VDKHGTTETELHRCLGQMLLANSSQVWHYIAKDCRRSSGDW
jgi:hypothetical protein